jgi:hypothetical protein
MEIKEALAQGQPVTLFLEPLGTFNGIVAWQRDGYLGMQFGELRIGAAAPKASAMQHEISRALPLTPEPDMPEVHTEVVPPAPATAFPSQAEIEGSLLAPKRRAPVEKRGPRDILKLVRGEQNVFTLKAGEVLFKAGDPAGRMYIVRGGQLSIDSITGSSEIIGSGGIVGESGLVEHDVARSATAVAVTDCELVEIDGRRFFSLIEEQPGFAVAVMQVLSRRLRHLEGPTEREPGLPPSESASFQG